MSFEVVDRSAAGSRLLETFETLEAAISYGLKQEGPECNMAIVDTDNFSEARYLYRIDSKTLASEKPVDKLEHYRVTETDLEWFLSGGASETKNHGIVTESVFRTSNAGSVYERQMNEAYDSSGKDLRNEYAKMDKWRTIQIHREQLYITPHINDVALKRYARVSRALMLLASAPISVATIYMDSVRASPYDVLVSFFGDSGVMWGGRSERSRCLFRFTEAGRKLIQMSKNDSPTELCVSDDARIADEIARQERKPNDMRRELLRKAALQADKLLHTSLDILKEVA